MIDDLGITSIWSDDILRMKDELKNEFNEMFESQLAGFRTFLLCMYENNVAYIEPIHAAIFPDSPLFFFSDARMTVTLDRNMLVESAVLDNGADMFLRMFYGETTEVMNIGSICHPLGWYWEAFTLIGPHDAAIERFDCERFPEQNLVVNEDDLIDCVMEFIEWKREKFVMEAEMAIQEEMGVSPGNPFEDHVYASIQPEGEDGVHDFGDQDVLNAINTGMRTGARRVGE